MSLQQFLLILRAHWKVLLGTLATTVATTLVVSLVMPRQYSANTSMVVDVKSPDPLLGVLLPAQVLPGYMATQVDIITSDRVAQLAVRLLGLDKNPTVIEEWQDATEGRGTVEVWLAQALQKKLDVKPSRESNVINIVFKGADPRFAAAVANAFAQAYIDTTLELKVEPAKQYAAWFVARTKQLRDAVEEAQGKLSSYQREHGIIAVDERLDVENARLAELSTQLVIIEGQKTESRQNQAGRDGETSAEVLQNSLIQALKGDVARQEAKREEIGSRVGKNHPEYQRISSEIDALRERVTQETRRVTSGLGTATKVNVRRESEIRTALEAQKEKVLALKDLRDQVSVLQKDVESAQRSYELVTQRLAQTSLESQTQQTNLVVLTAATPPLEPSSPRILLNTLVAIFLGTLLGVAATLLLELLSRRIRSPEDLMETVGLPLLAVIGPAEGKAAPARDRRHLMARLRFKRGVH